MPERRCEERYSRPRGFTLTELLVVIAVITLVTAILLPVLARSREKARQSACTGNLRQIGLATLQYAQDNDGLLFPSGYRDAAGGHVHWDYYSPPGPSNSPRQVDVSRGLLGAYLKSAAVWFCPSATDLHMHDGSGNPHRFVSSIYPSYGLNVAFFDGSQYSDHPVPLAGVAEPAETIFVADSAAQFLGVLTWHPFLSLPSGFRACVHGRHAGRANILWLDGHVTAGTPVASVPDQMGDLPVPRLQALHLGNLVHDPYTGDAKTDDFYYELTKP